MGSLNIDSCDDPLRSGRFRIDSVAIAPSEGFVTAKIELLHKSGLVWAEDAFLYVVLSPTADPDIESPSTYLWAQHLFSESQYVKYFSPLPTEERVPPQIHSLGLRLPFADLVDVDGTPFSFAAGSDYFLYMHVEVVKHNDPDGPDNLIEDCVAVAQVELRSDSSAL